MRSWGKFLGPARIELFDYGGEMKLLEDFVDLEPRGNAWTAPKNTVVNGASIPRIFWTITVDAFKGKYREASIV